MVLEVLEVAAEGVPVRVELALRLQPLLLDLLRDAVLRRIELLAQAAVLVLSRVPHTCLHLQPLLRQLLLPLQLLLLLLELLDLLSLPPLLLGALFQASSDASPATASWRSSTTRAKSRTSASPSVSRSLRAAITVCVWRSSPFLRASSSSEPVPGAPKPASRLTAICTRTARAKRLSTAARRSSRFASARICFSS